MFIKITKTDCSKIVNGTLQVGEGNAELVMALAKKCLALYDRIGEINKERNEYFEAIYAATQKFEEADKWKPGQEHGRGWVQRVQVPDESGQDY